MRIPKEIKYAGHTYKVKQPMIISPKKGKKEKMSYYGEADFRKQVIKICKPDPHSQKEETLLHEIIHLVNHHNSIRLKEDQIKYVSKDLYEILKTNKMLR